VQEVNLTSVYLCCKHVIPYMQRQGRGRDQHGLVRRVLGAATSQISYSASKGGVLAMSRELGVEFARQGIRVNALCPGPVNTPLLTELFAADAERAHGGWCTSRWAGSANPRRSPPRSPSSPATTPRSSPRNTFLVDGGISAAYVTPSEPVRVVSADDALFRPVRAGNPFEETVERLLQADQTRCRGSGPAAAAERELAARLGVSRVTLREAIRALTEAGTSSPRAAGTAAPSSTSAAPGRAGRGRRLAGSWAGGLEDALVLRSALEVGAAEAARARDLTDEEAGSSGAGWPTRRRRGSPTTAGWTPGCTWPSPRPAARVADLRGGRRPDAAEHPLDAIPLLERNIVTPTSSTGAWSIAILGGDPGAARQGRCRSIWPTAALLRAFLG
jgi:hypothetical protein